MMRYVAMALVLLAAAAAAEDEQPWLDQLPKRFRSGVQERIADAIQVWRLGADYIPADLPEPGEKITNKPLRELDRDMRWFLENGHVQSAVQFSCSVSGNRPEWRVEEALAADRPPELRLLALVILVRMHAPRSITDQWQAFQDLKELKGHPGLPWLLEQLAAEFAPRHVDRLLKREPPADRYTGDRTLEWAARAAGVTGHAGAIPRLVELSVGDNLDVSLAAEASLEEIPGADAERGLVACLLGWQYDAYVRAGRALTKRNPALLAKTLLAATPPKGCRYMQGVFLGRLGNPAAVPILCETIRGIRRLDGEMFDLIGKLATRDHLDLIEKLPDSVRDDQRKWAVEVRAAVRKRLG
jgi:hypothetical protein